MASPNSRGAVSDGAAELLTAPTLRQRATAIQVIGVPATDRSAQRQQRLGFSLLIALGLGWDSLMMAANPAAPFHMAIGRFLLIFAATVGSIRALGNLYDNYLDEADGERRRHEAAQRRANDAAAIVDTDQPAPGTD